MTLHPTDLNDKYDVTKDRVFITGTQAIVRLCLMQAERDRAAGLNTAGYVTGYRGSPLGGLDQQFPRARRQLDAANVVFEPALNEDLAATAIWGAQQAEMRGEGAYDGVFSIWYGKGPGVDRSGDVLRHANLAGTSRHGGVLVMMGDDHTCESSTTSHQSEYALVDAMIPILNPANVGEVMEYGLHGWALSRYAGVWCGLKCVKDTIESTASIDAAPNRFASVLPADHTLPEDGLNIRTGDTPQIQEARLHQHKIAAAQAFARANGIDRVAFGDTATAQIGIVSTGKSYMDVLQALFELGIDEARARDLGLAVYKVGMSWPLEPQGIAAFAAGLDHIIVVEEKRGLIEDQLRAQLYGEPHAPSIIGKKDEAGNTLFQAEAALNPMQIAVAIGKRVAKHAADRELSARSERLSAMLAEEREELGVERKPYFCAGCPHNSSTVLPDGARGYAGIGCHWMAQFMDREVDGYTHMGGEGANWIGESKFSKRSHVFQNLGDGTYNHSGLMALRAAVGSRTNITFKILYNDAVAMTGGQTHDGGMTVRDIAAEVVAAGATKLALVSEDPDRHSLGDYPKGTTLSHRDDVLDVQEELAAIPGVTVMLYDQTCAAEKRRRRKRGKIEDPAKRLFINEAVCEGCGDCGVQSNCVALVPVETEFGRKRQIDQSSCNKDYSCVKGFCPSFVSIEGGQLRKPEAADLAVPTLPEPGSKVALDDPYAIILAGVGGTGVVTIGALLGMAAHLEGRGCGIIDMAGLAQKGGAVTSHIKLAANPEDIGAIRIAPGGADLVLGCDVLVSAGEPLLRLVDKSRSRIVANTNEIMTGDFARDPDFRLPTDLMGRRLKKAVEPDAAHFVNATKLAEALLGDAIGGNLFTLGAAYQLGLIPLGEAAILKAIELNGVAVPFNTNAFQLGRWWVHDRAAVEALLPQSEAAKPVAEQSLQELIDRRAGVLTDYQNAAYAERYMRTVEKIRQVDGDGPLSVAVAKYLFKLMAYKDEYEVARLYTDGRFTADLQSRFEGDFKVVLHLAPPLLARRDKTTGHLLKREFGPWMLKMFGVLARFRRLRGTPFDIFGYTAERRMERRLISEYEALIDTIASVHETADKNIALQLAVLPEDIRGFGHVKQANVDKVAKRKADLMARLKNQSSPPDVQNAA
ncbi:MAG: indolepyruvate ferredoxin oxidoreductase family protein [Roseitalea sp.]|jgi:indolepyruvate ferredoxin oxidoreductase|nr:indolepyruvate ferredoxin oxidoreductase family protein [Roseitalea sp.]MBO6720818.1 indolepyruvate ferredoxin oxidoreductase family protein [Roseitalea sp.]MBO6743965.1 indolepyruvate ferredoxin oxidoreductase family protein [Roseitalea sp.]